MRNYSSIQRRRGFTLIELIIGIVIFGIVGALFTKLLTVQGKFFDKQGMGNAARNVSRASLNRVVSDFRMIEATGGVLAASATSITIKVPFAIGVVCGPTGAGTAVSLLPVDSVVYFAPGFYGYAWRSATTGAYTYVENPAAEEKNGGAAVCNAAAITTLTKGHTTKITPQIVGSSLGTPVFLYRRVRYEFKASAIVPGKIGLYRSVIFPNASEQSEELVAPFAATAKYRFFVVGNNDVAQDAPPANLADMRGIELHLDGVSETRVPGATSAESAPFTTAVFFKNRAD